MFISSAVKDIVRSMKDHSVSWTDTGSNVKHHGSGTVIGKPFFLFFGIIGNPSSNFQSTSRVNFNVFERIAIMNAMKSMVAGRITAADNGVDL